MSRFRKIALLMGTDLGYCRGVMRGIQQYVAQRRSWVFHDAPPELEVIPSLVDWAPDGIIAHLFRPEVAKAVLRLGVPLVNTTYTLTDLTVPLVEVDHLEVGRLAAEHFLERGFRQFGFLGNTTLGFARQREAGFRARLEEAGFTSQTCQAEFYPRLKEGANWSAIDNRVREWITTLPKPVAVLASNDVPARELADACRQLDLRIPETVAILGVDNDELECSLCYPPLSSIEIPSQHIGYRAAAILDEMLSRRRLTTSERTVFLPPIRVVTRASTDVLAIDDSELTAAIRYIQLHACDGLRVQELLTAVPIARRTLEKKCRDLLGRSPHEEIRRQQIATAKDLLASSDFSITAIAQRCGFQSSQRLAVAFKQAVGCTCRAYRHRIRQTS